MTSSTAGPAGVQTQTSRASEPSSQPPPDRDTATPAPAAPPPAPRPRARRRGQSYYAKKTTIVFVLVVGLVLVAGGGALTWWGTVSEVKDMLIIGPGCVVIGASFIVTSLIFTGRAYYYRVKEGRPFKTKVEPMAKQVSEENGTTGAPLYPTYDTPDSKLTNMRPPSGDLLYGGDLRRAMKASVLVKMLPPQSTFSVDSCTTTSTNVDSVEPVSPYQHAPSPVVALPTSAEDSRAGSQATYHVGVDSPADTPTSQDRPQSSLTAVENVDGTPDLKSDSNSRGPSPRGPAAVGVPQAEHETTELHTKEIKDKPDSRVDSGLGTPDNGLED